MSLRVTWLSAGTITDDEGNVLRRGESGLFGEQRARSLHKLRLGRICDDDPETEEVIQSTESQDPAEDAGGDGDGTD